MPAYRLLSILILIMPMAISSCTKTAEGTTGAAGPAGSDGLSVADRRSSIFGYVRLVNQYTASESTLDSVNVSTHMGDSVISVLTDKTGKFILPGLKSGTYRIMFKKRGYDSLGINVGHTSGNEDQFVDFVQVDGTQTTRITHQDLQLLLSPFDNLTKFVDIHTTLSDSPLVIANRRYMDIYFSSSRNLNKTDYMYQYNTFTGNQGTNTFDTQIFFSGTDINSTHFQPGDTVFVKSYIDPPYSLITSWFDTNSYQTVTYPYAGDSSINYFIWSN